ncbi:LacI family DNA-binding transcriptional regulator [Granulosicoccus sp. 3-233]|uniref:LacI family DNA-binding transcriptional regulator n=1 Tax=Granulosicoccus sp. 3-233 TaxID=3417969 RepID=UPI003D34BC06
MSRKASKARSITSRDVAALAGVSLMTVSRTLRTPEMVSPATRKRVQSAARELNYVPDLAAGSLSSKRSGHVAVLLPSLRHAGFLRTVDGLSDTLRDNGYHLLIGDCYYSVEQQLELLRMLLGRRPEAIVLISGLDSPAAQDLLARADIPVVETWHWPDEPRNRVVGFSQFDVGHAMARSLIEQGHVHIGFLGALGPYDPNGEQRRQGHLSALRDAGLRSDIQASIGKAPMEIEDGAKGASLLLDRFPEMDALACASDMTALGVLHECRRRDCVVPQQLAVAGFGDFDFAPYLHPSLTSVRLPSYRIGQQAAQLIMATINGETPPPVPHCNLGFELVHRQSTGHDGELMTYSSSTPDPGQPKV